VSDDLQLVLYRGASSATVGVRELLRDGAGEPVDYRHASVSVVVDGEERLADRLSLGPLEDLVAQLEPARARLADGRPGLVRSGVLDVEDGNYLLLEPADGAVSLSVVSTDELPASGWFPHGPWADQLYEYVARHRDAMLAATRSAGTLPAELPLDRAMVLAALEREAAAGAELLTRVS
jgi:hypothetical protein